MASLDVLVVDDDADGRNALTAILENDGYTVRQAENGGVAVKMIGECVPSIVLLDLEMPGMTGWEVLDWMHRNSAFDVIAIIVVSASRSQPTGVTFVSKPYRVEELLDVVRRAAGHEEIQVPDSWPTDGRVDDTDLLLNAASNRARRGAPRRGRIP